MAGRRLAWAVLLAVARGASSRILAHTRFDRGGEAIFATPIEATGETPGSARQRPAGRAAAVRG